MKLRNLLRRAFGVEKKHYVVDSRLGLGAGDLAPTLYEMRDAVQELATGSPAAFYGVSQRLRHVYPHILTEFLVRRATLSGISFEVKRPQSVRETPALIKAQERLQTLIKPAIKPAISAVQTSLLDGISPHELIYAETASGIGIKGLVTLRKDRFFIDQDGTQYSASGYRNQVQPLDDEQQMKLFIPHYTVLPPERDADHYGGLMRYASLSCALAFLTLYESVRLSERLAKPTRIGKYPAGLTADNPDVVQLRQAVRQMGLDLGAVISDDMMLEVLQHTTNAGSGISESVLNRLDATTAKLFNGTPMLTNESHFGTKAQATASTRSSEDLRWLDVDRAEERLTEDILHRLWYLNISTTEPCPLEVMSDYEPPEDLERAASVIETLGRAGLRIPTSHVYERFHIPEPKGDEEVLSATSTPPPLF